MAKKPVKKPADKKTVIPPEILTKLKRVKIKFFKEETITNVKKQYFELYEEDKKEHEEEAWSDLIFHKRALTKLKNKKKSEKLGGAVDKYYGIILGNSKTRDLSQKRRSKIIQSYEDDPQKAIDDELIVIRKATNPTTGEVEKVPILDDMGGIIPRDNVEFFTRKSGKKSKNPNFNNAISRAYRKTITGICSNSQGIKGVFIQELRDKSVELDIPINTLVKFSGKTLGTEIVTLDENNHVDKELLEEMIDNLESDIEQGIITEEFAKNMEKHYKNLLLLIPNEDEEETETGKEIKITLFKLRSTKGTVFHKVDNEKEFEIVDFPMRNDMEIDINLLYKEYFYPFTSDCSNLLNFHKIHRFIDGDPEKINWDEIVCLQDVNLIQLNMEASMGGNYTLYVEDESLFNKDISHLDEEINTIKLLVPSNINLNFAQDSKLNIIGSPVQFQAQDAEREEIWETKINDDGEEIQVAVLGYPLIMVHGIFPIPEYIIEVETVDMTDEDNADLDKQISEKLETASKEKIVPKDIANAIKDVEDIEKEIKSDITKKKPGTKTDEIDDEDEIEADDTKKIDPDIW